MMATTEEQWGQRSSFYGAVKDADVLVETKNLWREDGISFTFHTD